MEKRERLKMAIDYLRMERKINHIKDVAKMMGAHSSNVSSALKGNPVYLTENFLIRFNSAFGHIFDIGWLTDGKGTMLNANSESNLAKGTMSKYGKADTLPRLPFKAMSGGGLRAFFAGPLREECEERTAFDLFPQYQFTISVDTSDMSPYLNVGDLVACREIPIDHIIWGGVYLIDTDGGAMIRRVYEVEDNENKIKLSTGNHQHPDFLLEKSKVNGIYKIVGMARVGI